MAVFFFFNDSAPTEIYTLSLHDALPILIRDPAKQRLDARRLALHVFERTVVGREDGERSEEHTSELQSLRHLVCRLLLEKKKKKRKEVRSSSSNRCEDRCSRRDNTTRTT